MFFIELKLCKRYKVTIFNLNICPILFFTASLMCITYRGVKLENENHFLIIMINGIISSVSIVHTVVKLHYSNVLFAAELVEVDWFH